MSQSELHEILKQVEAKLELASAVEPVVEQAIHDLLNLVESLAADNKALLEKVKLLQSQLDEKKKAKTTPQAEGDKTDNEKKDNDHSSEARRRKLRPPFTPPPSDQRSFKDLVIHEEIPCPIDPTTLPPDAQRCADEPVVIQGVKIEPYNIRFVKHVYYSAAEGQFYRGSLPDGYGPGDFSPDLRSLVVSLKYCGGMSEPKIQEFLQNFDVRISTGSVSNILTNSAVQFEDEFHSLFVAGLASTPYQQTDDTSARVKGQFWHTHVVCNPFYSAYFTRPHKDRLTVVSVLQDQMLPQFRFNEETGELLEHLGLPLKWRERVASLGADLTLDSAALTKMLDEWFGKDRGGNSRKHVEQAAAIAYYRNQTAVPVVRILVCDDASQFELITDELARCWIHDGRHYEKLSPVVSQHAAQVDGFLLKYWWFYAELSRYRDGPTAAEADRLRKEFDCLFATTTGYAELDDRIAKTAAKKVELLTVLDHPEVPLHNNVSELEARVSARRRDVSLHSTSVRGARAMDIFTSLVQTCKKLGVSAYEYLLDRLSRRYALPSLAESIRVAAALAKG